MKVINARNVNHALPLGIEYLKASGVRRESRDGTVIQAPGPVTTVYERPMQRVLFASQRDANPFFHLWESLYFLQGRNDLAPLLRYVKTFERFSDDGVTLHGSYGYRWRKQWGDQLKVIAETLQKNPNDRRCVLQMWDTELDLGRVGKDVPCNDTATFQISTTGELDLVVFCRSNDAIMGAYGANAVHFSMLLEYMASWIGVPVGKYTQVSVNFHMYERDMQKVEGITPIVCFDVSTHNNVGKEMCVHDDYFSRVHVVLMVNGYSIEQFDEWARQLLHADGYDYRSDNLIQNHPSDFFKMCFCMFQAHSIYKFFAGVERFQEARRILALGDQKADWIVAGTEWINRREAAWRAKQ